MTAVMEIKLEYVSQLFETLDPFPFCKRDLAKAADEYICKYASELPENSEIVIIFHLPNDPEARVASATIGPSVKKHFTQRSTNMKRELKELFRQGRRAMAIGLAVLGLCLLAGKVLENPLGSGSVAHFITEGLIIAGWVALWRPLEIFLYDWWPLAQQRRLYSKLAGAIVRVQFDNMTTT